MPLKALLFLLIFSLTSFGQIPQFHTRAHLSLPHEGQGCAGYFAGVSGASVGRVGRYVLVAGGCNFPERSAADGGPKVFYREVYAARWDQQPLRWQLIGHLPEALAYGMTVSDGRRIIIAGGQTPTPAGKPLPNGQLAPTSRTLALRYDGRRLRIDSLPPMPIALSGGAAALVGRQMVVVGGADAQRQRATTFVLDLRAANTAWRQGADYPSPPLLKVVATAQREAGVDGFYLFGSMAGHNTPDSLTTLSPTALRYDPRADRWTPLPLPTEAIAQGHTFGGGVAWPVGRDFVAFAGGVHAPLFLNAINRGKRQAMLHRQWAKLPADEVQFRTLYPVDEADPQCMAAFDSLLLVPPRPAALAAPDSAALSTLLAAHDAAFACATSTYLRHTPDWYRFGQVVWLLHLPTRTWHAAAPNPDFARADAGLALLPDGRLLLIGGETMPGVRT
ncbi:MAG: hypothetical protein HUK09_08465, partial [Bacteroidaceae bacterium]|nr:hypothetical protein [Bacteroidaceae bacterium]